MPGWRGRCRSAFPANAWWGRPSRSGSCRCARTGDAGELVEADFHPLSDRGHAERIVVVADAMGVTGAGIFGDILCMRMVKRGVTALITDGVMRDKHGVVATGLPVWCAGVAAPASVNQ